MNKDIDKNIEFDYLDVDVNEILQRKQEKDRKEQELLLEDTLELNFEGLNIYE